MVRGLRFVTFVLHPLPPQGQFNHPLPGHFPHHPQSLLDPKSYESQNCFPFSFNPISFGDGSN